MQVRVLVAKLMLLAPLGIIFACNSSSKSIEVGNTCNPKTQRRTADGKCESLNSGGPHTKDPGGPTTPNDTVNGSVNTDTSTSSTTNNSTQSDTTVGKTPGTASSGTAPGTAPNNPAGQGNTAVQPTVSLSLTQDLRFVVDFSHTDKVTGVRYEIAGGAWNAKVDEWSKPDVKVLPLHASPLTYTVSFQWNGKTCKFLAEQLVAGGPALRSERACG